MSAEPAAVASTVNATDRPASAAPSLLRVRVAVSEIEAPSAPEASATASAVAPCSTVSVADPLDAL